MKEVKVSEIRSNPQKARNITQEGDDVKVTKHSHPMFVIVSLERYEELSNGQES